MLDASSVRSMPEADSLPTKLEPCVRDLDGAHAFYLRRKTLGLGLGHNCYITSTTQSPVSLLNPQTLLSSAVKTAPMFFGILRISVIGPYNLFSSCSQHQILDLPPTLLVANMHKPSDRPLKSSESSGDVEWNSALSVYTELHIHSEWKQAWCSCFHLGKEMKESVVWRMLLLNWGQMEN